jgi:hypothetical protein
MDKVLWVVSYNSLSQFVQRAKAAKVTAVAIRTSNDIAQAIPAFHGEGMKVYGWRWPSAKQVPAMNEANRVVTLLAQGMDGYFADPEGEPGKPWDWNRTGLDQLADDFCSAIKSAANGKPFGTTSHYLGKQVFAKLPWASFFNHTDVFLPQAYWRVAGGAVFHGKPAENYQRSIQAWIQTGAVQGKIQPMAGELVHVNGPEIGQYAAEAINQNVSVLHFYTDEDGIDPAVWNAIAQT